MAEHYVLKQAREKYSEVFGGEPEVKVFAPGRVNLIGGLSACEYDETCDVT